MSKRIISILMSFLIICSFFCELLVVNAQDIIYDIDQGAHIVFDLSTGKIKSYYQNDTVKRDIIIPNSINSINVTGIGAYAFNYALISSVSIPYGVVSIDEYAFLNSSVSSAFISSSVISIGSYAFEGTLLSEINIPNGVISIGENAFKSCNNLTSATIPQSVTCIGPRAFELCQSLNSINVEDSNQYYASEDGLLLNKDKTILIQFPFGKSGHYTLPYGITSIGEFAFTNYNSNLNLVLPESITVIEKNAFEFCSGLKSIELPNSLKEIGFQSFYFCTGLTSLTIPSSVINIEKNAFTDCSNLSSLTISDGVTNIQEGAFESCFSLTSVTIPKSIVNIPSKMFYKCNNLTSIKIDDGIKQIGDSAFSECSKLTSVAVPESVNSIRSFSFRKCSKLASVIISSINTFISYNSFDNCSDSLTIYGLLGSNAESFADEESLPFIAIDNGAVSISIQDAPYNQATQKLNINLKIINNLNIKLNAKLILTATKSNQYMAGLIVQDIDIDGGENLYSYSLPVSTGDIYIIKALLFNGMNELIPISLKNMKEIEI